LGRRVTYGSLIGNFNCYNADIENNTLSYTNRIDLYEGPSFTKVLLEPS